MIAGTPDEVRDQIREYRDAGVSYMQINFMDFPDSESSSCSRRLRSDFEERVIRQLATSCGRGMSPASTGYCHTNGTEHAARTCEELRRIGADAGGARLGRERHVRDHCRSPDSVWGVGRADLRALAGGHFGQRRARLGGRA